MFIQIKILLKLVILILVLAITVPISQAAADFSEAAPAPPLKSVRISAVQTSSMPEKDNIKDGQTVAPASSSRYKDKYPKGKYLYLTVITSGTGTAPIVYCGGSVLDSKVIKTRHGNDGAIYVLEVIVDKLKGTTTGDKFFTMLTVQSTSLNHPKNTYADTLTIYLEK